MSFLVAPESFRDALNLAGFDIEIWKDETELAKRAFANAAEPVGESSLPVLNVYLLVGTDIQTKAYNLHRNLDEERVSLIETLAVKPVAAVSWKPGEMRE